MHVRLLTNIPDLCVIGWKGVWSNYTVLQNTAATLIVRLLFCKHCWKLCTEARACVCVCVCVCVCFQQKCCLQAWIHLLQHTATHCDALQRTATHCNALQRTATHYSTEVCCHVVYRCMVLFHMGPIHMITSGKRLIQMCDTTHSSVWHDSFIWCTLFDCLAETRSNRIGPNMREQERKEKRERKREKEIEREEVGCVHGCINSNNT